MWVKLVGPVSHNNFGQLTTKRISTVSAKPPLWCVRFKRFKLDWPRYVTVIGDLPWILQWQFGVRYDRTAFFFCEPEVLDLGICWMCNSDYVVKGGKSVTTGSVRLNKQRGGIFASNSNIFYNAGSMRMFMLFILYILKCRRHENVCVVCSVYSQMPRVWKCLCCLFFVFSNAWGMRMFMFFVLCILKCPRHENIYVACSVYSQMPTAWECL
jgi:hypothetical protein